MLHRGGGFNEGSGGGGAAASAANGSGSLARHLLAPLGCSGSNGGGGGGIGGFGGVSSSGRHHHTLLPLDTQGGTYYQAHGKGRAQRCAGGAQQGGRGAGEGCWGWPGQTTRDNWQPLLLFCSLHLPVHASRHVSSLPRVSLMPLLPPRSRGLQGEAVSRQGPAAVGHGAPGLQRPAYGAWAC